MYSEHLVTWIWTLPVQQNMTLGSLGRVLLSAHRRSLRSLDCQSLYAAAVVALPSSRAGYGTISSSCSSSSSFGASDQLEQLTKLTQQLFSSSNSSSDISGAAATAASSFSAAQPLEPLAQLLNPFVLGSSVWEMVHTASGLPWWGSILLTTVAMRTVMLPLTLKAKSAALNWVLLQHSFYTADRLLEQMHPQRKQQQTPGAGGAAAQPPRSQQQLQQLKKPGKLKLVRMYYRYFRRQQKTTSMWWWAANAAVQANTFVIMSVALRQMADAQWPGMATEGLSWITDLTQPAVVWGTWVCPYRVSGYGLPFVMLMLYLKTIELSPAVRSPRLKLILDCGVLPVYVLSCLVPQATLLYWLGNSIFFTTMQAALNNTKVARAVGLPNMLLPTPRGAQEERERAELEAADARQLICGSEDDGFLRFLAANFLSSGRHQQALQCLQRLTVLAPGDGAAFSALGRTAAELQQWPAAAAAYERSADLAAAAGEVEEQATELALAGKHWLNAVAECRQLAKAAAAAKEKAGSGNKSSSSSSTEGKSVTADSSSSGSSEKAFGAVLDVTKQQDYIIAAVRTLEAAVALPAEAAVEGSYLLAMAYTAAGDRAKALATSQSYWAKACDAAASGDIAAKSNATAKLLPVLANLCKQYHVASEDEALMAAAKLGVEVAQAGWDRQSQEQLHDMLGTAAQSAAALGRFTHAEQLKQLQQKLGNGSGRKQGS